MAKKKKHTGNVFLIIFAILLLVGGGYGLYHFNLFNIQQSFGYGYTSLSISSVEVIDSGERIRIYAVANGAEELRIDWNADKITPWIQSDGYEATKGVGGEINLESQTKKFMLSKNNEELYKRLKSEDVGRFTTCSTSKCASEAPYGYVHNNIRFRSPTLVCICMYEKGEGVNSVFTGQEIDDSVVNFNIGGATGQLKPAQGQNTITLNDGKTKIEWIGSLNNYEQIHYPQYNVLFKASKYDKLIRLHSWSDYKDTVDNFGECVGAGSNFFINYFMGFGTLVNLQSVDKITNCVNTFNNGLDTILVDKTIDYSNSINAEGISFGSNSLNVELKTASTFPTFIITLDAESVGIVELIGDPDIVSCVPDIKINSGDTIAPTLKVRNKGTQSGSFYGSVICSGDSTVSGIISEQLVSAGQTIDMPIQITGSNTVEGIKNSFCTYTVTDRKSGNTDSCSSTISVEYQAGLVCDPGTWKCLNADTLRKCSADGKSYEDEKCELGCVVLEGGIGKCAVKEPISKECPFGQEWHEKGDRFLGIFPGKSAGCYTSAWVFWTILVSVVLIILLVWISIRYRRPRRPYYPPQPRRRY